MNINRPCPNCGSENIRIIFRVDSTPVHSVVLLRSHEAAMNYPMGQIVLGQCSRCGFISNMAFDADLMDYASEYESTQSCSPTFNEFNRKLATGLINRHALRGKKIVEIGCGQGEFLELLCEIGKNDGLGVDPAYTGPAVRQQDGYAIHFIADYFPTPVARLEADLICCKMTMEHIPQTRDFMRTIHAAIPEDQDPVVFVQVPDAGRILRENAFWDIYYEHCSYFTSESLMYLFESTGFEVLKLDSEYGSQYLLIEARRSRMSGEPNDSGQILISTPGGGEVQQRDGVNFSREVQASIERWQKLIEERHAAGKKIVIWGAGSKGVAFLNALKIREQVRYAVDVNPRKENTFLAGTGQRIVAPKFLADYRPDAILIMNPVYLDEIQATITDLGILATLIPVE